MTKTEQWAANQKFLDEQVAKGAKFVLSTAVKDLSRVPESSFFGKELRYMISKGYRLAENGRSLIK